MLIACSVLFVLAAAISFFVTYPVRQIALATGVVDKPEKRKMHQIPVPLLGGIGVFVAFLVTSFGALLMKLEFRMISPGAYFGLIAGGAVVLVLGILDDVLHLTPRQKLAGQALAALVVVVSGSGVNILTNPLGESFQIG